MCDFGDRGSFIHDHGFGESQILATTPDLDCLLLRLHTQQVTMHWLRHTTLTWVERNFGYAIARAYARHDGKSDAGTTSTYVRADVYEVARALATLTGESHPLAES